MALPADFSKIFASTATGGITPPTDVNYAKGWEWIGSNPPEKNDFNYLQNLSDLKAKWLYDYLKAPYNAASRVVGAAEGAIPDMSLFAAVREGKGYQRFPGGMIIQWGRSNVVTANSSSDFIIDTLKIAFPGAALQCVATVYQTQVNTPCFACAEVINKTQVKIQAVAIDLNNKNITNGQIVPVSWVALGY